MRVATLRTEILTIGVVKGFNPVLVYGGAYSTMSVQLVNPNNTALTGIAFTDDMALLGAGMELADPVTFDVGTCGGVLTGNPEIHLSHLAAAPCLQIQTVS